MRREERLRKEAKIEEARKAAAQEAAAQVKRDNAAKARAAYKTKRDEAKAAGVELKNKARVYPTANRDSLGGRILLRLEQLSKTREALAAALGISVHSVALVLRDPTKTMRNANLVKTAAFLDVTVEWLRHGDVDKDKAITNALVPHTAQVFKANGRHAALIPRGQLNANMDTNIDTTLHALWPLLSVDLKVFVTARVAELVAMQAHKGS